MEKAEDLIKSYYIENDNNNPIIEEADKVAVNTQYHQLKNIYNINFSH